MDNLVYPQPTPAPLILPRRLSLHGNLRGQRSRYPSAGNSYYQPPSPSSDRDELGGNSLTHYFYFPTATFPPHRRESSQSSQVPSSLTALNPNPPAIFSFGNERGQDGAAVVFTGSGDNNGTVTTYPGPATSIHGRPSRRHSISSGSPWATVPPRHALHMPVMKVDPTIWRSEQHQREIYRLMHEGREEAVMKRRGIKSVMDTTEEEDDEHDMSGVVPTMDLGGFRATEEREKELVREQVRQEWARLVEEQTREYERLLRQVAADDAIAQEARRRNSWPKQLGQQQVQFKTPGQILHPLVVPSYMQQSNQHQRLPEQPPAPGQQQGQGRFSAAAPLSNPANWSAAAVYRDANTSTGMAASGTPGYSYAVNPVDTRRPSFTAYRG
ncbi:hypothetical protein BGX28_001748, partial [Mortierella sp. GBA30]